MKTIVTILCALIVSACAGPEPQSSRGSCGINLADLKAAFGLPYAPPEGSISMQLEHYETSRFDIIPAGAAGKDPVCSIDVHTAAGGDLVTEARCSRLVYSMYLSKAGSPLECKRVLNDKVPSIGAPSIMFKEQEDGSYLSTTDGSMGSTTISPPPSPKR